MKPVRNYAILGKLLHEYKVPSFRLTTDNYMRTLRLCSNMEQIEQQMVLDAYEHVHIFHTNQFISPTEVVLAVGHVDALSFTNKSFKTMFLFSTLRFRLSSAKYPP